MSVNQCLSSSHLNSSLYARSKKRRLERSMASSRKRSALSPLGTTTCRALCRARSQLHKAGTVLYKVLWQGFPPEVATWEEEDDIPCGEVDYVARRL